MNLADLSRPGDVYTGISDIVKEVVARDADILRAQGVRVQASEDGAQVWMACSASRYSILGFLRRLKNHGEESGGQGR